MINLSLYNEWQYLCPRTGLVMPWYTKPFLDILRTWDLAGLKVFEYGAGASTLWWQDQGCIVWSVDSSLEYIEAVKVQRKRPSVLLYQEMEEGYIHTLDLSSRPWDIIVVDGMYRDQCATKAYWNLRQSFGGILIIDNWMQPSVWVASEETRELLGEPTGCYRQPGHPDWQTAYWEIKMKT